MLTINVLSTIIFVLATEEPSFLQVDVIITYVHLRCHFPRVHQASVPPHRVSDPYCRVFYLIDTAHWQQVRHLKHCTQCVHFRGRMKDVSSWFVYICIHLTWSANILMNAIGLVWSSLSDKTVSIEYVFYVRLICVVWTRNVFSICWLMEKQPVGHSVLMFLLQVWHSPMSTQRSTCVYLCLIFVFRLHQFATYVMLFDLPPFCLSVRSALYIIVYKISNSVSHFLHVFIYNVFAQ